MDRAALYQHILSKRSFLSVGLDTDPEQIPEHLRGADDPVFEFNKGIIDATLDHCIGYKLNTAFYEGTGSEGWKQLEKTIGIIPRSHFIIADAKRGDIGNTSAHYAKAFFDKLGADAITVAPYMGEDSVKPFLQSEGKWVILLALTSNAGSADFQMTPVGRSGRPLFEEVIRKSMEWGTADQLMYVIGATRTEQLQRVRDLAPEHFLLVPGIGAQGGDLEAVSRAGMNARCGLIVNASRSILYASVGADFASAAASEAEKIHDQMDGFLGKYLIS